LAEATIYLLEFGSNTFTQLVTQGFTNYYPVWSPDGTTIAYMGQGNDQNLRAIDVATGEVHYILDSGVLGDLVGMPGLVYGFDWSPDSTQLVAGANLFDFSQGGGYDAIFVMNACIPSYSQRGVRIISYLGPSR
jgi:Tol biopolymer transport system component